jgi:hypothetical protein
VVNGNKHDIGKMIKFNNTITKITEYHSEELQDQNFKLLLPPYFASTFHSTLIE